jgi:hypothetical protein
MNCFLSSCNNVFHIKLQAFFRDVLFSLIGTCDHGVLDIHVFENLKNEYKDEAEFLILA